MTLAIIVTKFCNLFQYVNCYYCRDGCVAVYETNEHDITPHLLVHIKDCHEGGVEEVSAVEKVGNTVVTVSNRSSNICFWQLEKKSNPSSFFGSSSYVCSEYK